MKNEVTILKESVRKEIETKAIQNTIEFIKCKSYNPPGDEKKAAKFAATILEQAGFTVEVEEFETNRCNVLAYYGNPEDIALIFNGHLDVVPAFGEWTCLPDSAERKDGKIWGRGSCDMLGGCAAILAAAEQIKGLVPNPRRGIMVLLVSDEEDKNKGIRHILRARKLHADGAIVAEPTECEIQLGNRGFSSFYIRTTGEACHASEPWNGENAIYKMGSIIQRFQKYADSLSEVRDPFLGQATACIGTIHGGIRLNTVPDACIMEVERRLLPGEEEEQIKEEIQQIAGEDAKVENRSFFPASLIDKEHPLVKKCAWALEAVQNKKPAISVFKACTEASMFSVYCKIPTLLLGPGSLKQAHRVDEYCKEEDITDCAKAFLLLMHQVLTDIDGRN